MEKNKSVVYFKSKYNAFMAFFKHFLMSEKLVKSIGIRIAWKNGTANNSFCWNERLKKIYINANIQTIDGFHDKYRKVMF